MGNTLLDNMEDYMEEYIKVLPFTSYNLGSLAEITGIQDASKVIDSGLNVDFCNLIARVCREISTLYNLDETVAEISKEEDMRGFLFELSAFLGDLECPHESITCGAIEGRFASAPHRSFLFNYLMDQVKAARLFAVNQLEKGNENRNDLPTYIISTLKVLNISVLNKVASLSEAVNLINIHADKALQSLTTIPQPMLQPNSMNEARWRQVNAVTTDLAQDCRSRLLILLKRMDVTVNSFLWSDRVRKQEESIRTLYSQRRHTLCDISVPGMPALLSATDLLLRVEPASSKKRRRNTRSSVKPVALSEAPADRGGRTDEIRVVKDENPYRQQRHQNFGGGHRGGHKPSFENTVRQEYTDRTRDNVQH